jgi:hypothetical protein
LLHGVRSLFGWHCNELNNNCHNDNNNDNNNDNVPNTSISNSGKELTLNNFTKAGKARAIY